GRSYAEYLFFWFLGIVDDIDYAAPDGEHQLLTVDGLKGDSERAALPGRGRAFRVGIVGSGGFTCVFFQDRLPASDVSDDGVKFLAVLGDAAVSDVVAIPARRRIEGIELGQVQLRNTSSEAVDQQPATALPLPARGAGRFRGQRIVDAKSAPDHEQAVG